MKKLLWVDMEMTGLDEHVHHILEVAAIVTDLDFTLLEEYHRVVHQPAEVMALMDAWCVKTHGDSGLTTAVATGTPLPAVEQEMLQLLDRHYARQDRVILCGNSIGQDRKFIDRHMIDFSKRLHYRMIDVSSFKEIFREKYGVQFEKGNKHRAIDDIHESIRELQGYLKYIQVPSK
jgi:oligoribonuclease